MVKELPVRFPPVAPSEPFDKVTVGEPLTVFSLMGPVQDMTADDPGVVMEHVIEKLSW